MMKKKEKNKKKKGQNRIKKNSITVYWIECWNDVQSVSYTHLDVYKRQMLV